MGDQIADLPQESEIPPLPPKTYQWEDIRRQKLEGRYPWTHFYKEPFDDKKWQEAKMEKWPGSEGKKRSKDVICGCQYFDENNSSNTRWVRCKSKCQAKYGMQNGAAAMGEHEYEPVIPMDFHKSPPPIVKITPDRECPLPAARRNIDSWEPTQDKNHLLVPPPRNEYDDAENGDNDPDSDSDDPSEEITAEELQLRLEEKYFRSPSPSSSIVTASTKHEYESTETRSVSPALTDDRPSSSHSTAGDTPKLSHKMQLQADKLRRRFKSFKEQISKEYTDCSPHTKRKASLDYEPTANSPAKQRKPKVRKQPKKNKFNFRRHGNKKSAAPPKLPSEPDLRDSDEQSSPQSSFRRFSFRSLRSLRRSPSNSSSVKERKRSLSSESPGSKKRFDFHFGTYPRSIFGKRSKKVENWQADDTSLASKPKSTPGTPLPRRSTFSQGWMRKLTMERKKHPKEQHKTTKDVKKDEHVDPADTVVKETIFISLHEDAAKRGELQANAQADPNPASTRRPNSPPGLPPTPPETALPTKIDIDNKNFFFISLHEERFPDKLHKGNSQPADFSQEEIEIERELKKAQTARKFHNMLRKLETDRKLKNSRGEHDDKPEPVVITEVPADDEDDGFRGAEGSENFVQTPGEEEKSFGRYIAEVVPPEKLSFEEKESSGKSEMLFKSLGKIEISKKVGWDKLKFGKRSPSREKDVKGDFKVEAEEEIKVTKELPVKACVYPTTVTPLECPVHADMAESPRVNGFHEVEEPSQPEVIPEVAEVCLAAPRKMPRKKPKTLGSERESKESLSAFEDSTFTDAIMLDEQKSFSKTYIKASLDEIPLCLEPIEPEHTARQFKEYERALEKNRTYRSIELKNNFYSPQNTLARLETPIPPHRPNRKGTLTRTKREKSAISEHKENVYDLEANQSFNTFPLMKPDKPRRTLRKHRTYSNSTNNTENAEIKNIDELEDEAINQNIVNSKQLSVSFLPLTSNIVGEPITDYNLRETSSMIHLNFNPPLPPKRRKGLIRNEAIQKYNTMPNQKYVSKTSLSPSEAYNMDLNTDGEIEYADDVNSTIPDSDSPPKRPTRRRSTGPSTVDEDRTSRGIESISSERSSKDDPDFCDDDPKDVHGYAIIGKPGLPRPSQTQSEGRPSESGTSRRKSRRFSDFFTFPRIRVPTNYVTTSQTLDRRRLPSPSRPPRRGRPLQEPTYGNDDTNVLPSSEELQINFDGEEQLNFNLATEDDSIDQVEDSKNLQAEDILEKMKVRPLPPPPRPTRKPRDDGKSEHYSQSTKRKSTHITNNLGQSVVEEKIINTTITTTAGGQISETESKNWLTNECSNLSTRFEHQTGVETRISQFRIECAVPEESSQSTSSTHQYLWDNSPSQAEEVNKTMPINDKSHTVIIENISQGTSSTQQLLRNPIQLEDTRIDFGNDESTTVSLDRSSDTLLMQPCLRNPIHPKDTETQPRTDRESTNPTDKDETTRTDFLNNLRQNPVSSGAQAEQTHPNQPNRNSQNLSENTNPTSGAFNSISASKLEISELNVAKLNVGEIESSRLLTSTVDSSRLQVSSIQSEAGTLLLNAVAFGQHQSSPCSISGEPSLMVEQRDVTPSSDDAASEPAKQRPRISSMITEVGSDEEPNSKVTKVVRPNRRKQSLKRLSEASASCSYSSTDSDRPTLTDLMCQILQICHSSVGQAIHSLLEQIIPEDREKRNEVQAAIWVMTIIVAGCLMLGLQSNEKIVHHHHWDFHFPPPH